MLRNYLFPSGASGDDPRIVLSGKNHLLIEKHHGIIGYTRDKLTVRVGNGYISVTGHALEISEYGNLDMIVFGEISSLEFVNV
ncbi:MAG: YabP/YqfC family sporulation protein [Clostridia bacterium]|nr:YabP/YqfC family sporulation protein [Clostridia bacterium]